jgi:ureidoacrylate peracid hydrolase
MSGQTKAAKDAGPAVFGDEYFEFEPGNAALLVIDMQNSFVADGAVFQAPHGQDIIPTLNRLIEKARAASMPVIWTQSDHSPPGGGLILDRYPVIRDTDELWKGSESFDLFPEVLEPNADEHRVVKHKYDAFHDTDLDRALRNLGKDTVIITGVATEVCCESTARAAFFHDYKVVCVKDAMAAFDPDVHDATCERLDKIFGRVMAAEEVEAVIAGVKR